MAGLLTLLLVVVFSALVIDRAEAYSFLSVGDWGGAYVGYQDNVNAVAAQMDTVAQSLNPGFIIGTGDNFYWCGIQYVVEPPSFSSPTSLISFD